jgi:hypothetical protein
MPVKYVLRDLPGVAEFEAMVARVEALPNSSWAPEGDELQAAADRLSRTLFGISEGDTQFSHDDDMSDEEYAEYVAGHGRWEANFAFLSAETDEEMAAARLIWEAMGWDVLGGNGEEMLSLIYMERQIVCAMKGLAGRRPDSAPSDDEIAVNAEGWATVMEREAKAFRR